MTGNCFVDNGGGTHIGIQVADCLAQLNTVVRDRVQVFGRSEIVERNNLIASPIALEMLGPDTVPEFDAPENYWGPGPDSSVPSIRARIFDCTMNPSLGCIITSEVAPGPILGAPDIQACRNGELPVP